MAISEHSAGEIPRETIYMPAVREGQVAYIQSLLGILDVQEQTDAYEVQVLRTAGVIGRTFRKLVDFPQLACVSEPRSSWMVSECVSGWIIPNGVQSLVPSSTSGMDRDLLLLADARYAVAGHSMPSWAESETGLMIPEDRLSRLSGEAINIYLERTAGELWRQLPEDIRHDPVFAVGNFKNYR